MSKDMRVNRVAAPLRQQVINVLRSAIMDGEYSPGDRMIERELCETIGVSRTLIREALRQLEAEKLVVVVPHKGPMVRSIEADEATQLYQVRAVLEGLLAELVAEGATAKQKKSIRESFQKMGTIHERGDFSKLVSAKNAFYEHLIKSCKNMVLADQLTQLHARLSLLRSLSLVHPGRAEKSLEEVGVIVNAIERNDGPTARDATIAHIEAAGKLVRALLQDPKEVSAKI